MEQLDHRQLLAVNFTGNVTNDFTAATPAVYLSDPNNLQPLIPPTLAEHRQGLGVRDRPDRRQLRPGHGHAERRLPPAAEPEAVQRPDRPVSGDRGRRGQQREQLDHRPRGRGRTACIDDPAISQTENFNAVIDLSGGTNTATQSIFAGIPNAATPGYTNSTYVVAPAVFTSGTAIDSAVPRARGPS